MGTTDTFDSPAFAGPITASDTLPIKANATGRAATANLDMITAVTGKFRYLCIEGNLGTLASLGTSAVATANATYVSPVHIKHPMLPRSEERRVGKECRSRWST